MPEVWGLASGRQPRPISKATGVSFSQLFAFDPLRQNGQFCERTGPTPLPCADKASLLSGGSASLPAHLAISYGSATPSAGPVVRISQCGSAHHEPARCEYAHTAGEVQPW